MNSYNASFQSPFIPKLSGYAAYVLIVAMLTKEMKRCSNKAAANALPMSLPPHRIEFVFRLSFDPSIVLHGVCVNAHIIAFKKNTEIFFLKKKKTHTLICFLFFSQCKLYANVRRCCGFVRVRSRHRIIIIVVSKNSAFLTVVD